MADNVPFAAEDLTSILIPLATDQDFITIGFRRVDRILARMSRLIALGWSIEFARVRVQHCVQWGEKFHWTDSPEEAALVREMLRNEYDPEPPPDERPT